MLTKQIPIIHFMTKQDDSNNKWLEKKAFKIGSLSIVIPVYNSENTIEPLVNTIIAILKECFNNIEIILVNDGSIDGSHTLLVELASKNAPIVKYIRLARNFGEHNAVMCGLNYVTGDCAVIVDDDFQNPPMEILKLVNKLEEGYDVVYSCYEKKHHNLYRNMGSAFNNFAANILLKKPANLYLSSFKAINAFLIKTIVKYNGPNPYLDGIILKSTTSIGQQLCKHEKRIEGKSGYNFVKLFDLWLNMFLGFSVVPLRIASFTGIAMSLFAIVLMVFFIISHSYGGFLFNHQIPPGWASLIVTITFFTGIQLSILGLFGEYLGRLFLTVHHIPQYVIRDKYNIDDS